MPTSRTELRPAEMSDCEMVWRLNNRREVRAVSQSPQRIEWDEHRQWYAQQLQAPKSLFLIVEVKGDSVGVLRITRTTDDTAIVSIALNPAQRGRGVGRRSIRDACEQYAVAYPHMTIEAWISEDNHASARCFCAAGFKPVRTVVRHGPRWHIYEWSRSV